jgi:undecaprenyl-diphosphatase
VVLALAWMSRDGGRGATPLALGLVIALGILTQRLVPQPGPPIETLRDFHWLALSSGDSLSSQAFPSGHVARTTFLAFLLAGRHLSTAPLMAALVSAMALSRVYIGSHWASDVVGGLFLGASISLLCISVGAWAAARRVA